MLILIVILLILALGAAPQWPYWQGRQVGYYPSAGLLVIVLILLFVFGYH